MKSTDLMIGDWVYRPDCYSKVKEIRENGIIGLDHLRGIISFEELKPIPLTPEILEKNGFESCKEGYDIGIPLLYWDKYCTAVCGWTHCSNIIEVFDCRYVHELQHLFKLCGIDKKIEL